MDNLRLILLALGVVVVAAIWAFEAWRRRRNAAARDDPFADFDSDDLSLDELPPWQEQAEASSTDAPARQRAEPAPVAGRGRREPEPRDLFDQSIADDDGDGPPLGDLSPLAERPDGHDGERETSTPRISRPSRTAAPEQIEPIAAEDEAVSRDRRPRAQVEPRPQAVAKDPEDDAVVEDTQDVDGPSQPAVAEDDSAPATAPRAAQAATVVSLLIMARPGRRFVGHQVRAALESVGLRYGAMQIFHYHDDDEDDTPLFSAVNALKPGTFDLARLGELSTTGVALFMQVPGPGDTSRVFELMLDTARHLAERLGGDLGDAARRPLSAARLQELRATAAGGDTR